MPPDKPITDEDFISHYMEMPPDKPTDTPEDGVVERLAELLGRATPTPWELQDGCSWRRIGTREGNGNVLCPSTYSAEDRHPDLTCGKGEDLYANLRLIVEGINALPALLATNADLERKLGVAKTALSAAKCFIGNGIELGFIRMPDPDTPDPAHDTPPMIDAALKELN